MLKIKFEAETCGDSLNPINIAAGLINSHMFSPEELVEIAYHLYAYGRRKKEHRDCIMSPEELKTALGVMEDNKNE